MTLTTEQWNTINRIFSEKRLLAFRERERRTAFINKNIPEFLQASNQIIELSLAGAKNSLKHGNFANSSANDVSSEIETLIKRKKQLLVEHGYPENYTEDVYECSLCQDKGYVSGKRCICLDKIIIDYLFDQSGIKEELLGCSFSLLSEKYYKGEDLIYFKNAVERSKSFVNNFESSYQNLIFYGTVGTGKSQITKCIAKELLEKGCSVIYYSAIDLMNTISRDTFDNHNKFESGNGFNHLYESDLLIIDDLGTESNNQFTVSSLFSLINERFLRKKPIIISTNLSIEEIRTLYTDRIFSRIAGSFDFCKMSGPDIRIIQKMS